MAAELLSQVNLRNTSFVCDEVEKHIKHARTMIAEQNTQRRTVSTAVLISIIFNTVPSKDTVLSLLTGGEPAVNKRNLQAWIDNVEVLVQLEQGVPGCVPCGIDAFQVTGFAALTQDRKLNAVESIKQRVTRDTIGAAMKRVDVINKARPPFAGVTCLYHDIRAADGTLLTEIRSSDGYTNVLKVLAGSGKNMRDYLVRKANGEYCDSFRIADQPLKAVLEEQQNDKSGAVWAHSNITLHAAHWVGSQHVQELEELLPQGLPVIEHDLPSLAPDPVCSEAIQDINHWLRRRQSDGFVDATRLSAGIDKKWSNFANQLDTKLLIQDIQERTMTAAVVQQRKITWVDPVLAATMLKTNKSIDADGLIRELAKPFVATDIIEPILDANGQVVSHRRSSDGYVNITELSHSASKKVAFKDFLKRREAKDLVVALGDNAVQTYRDKSSGTWVDVKLAILFVKMYKLDVPCLQAVN